jgi:hypothetical protein
LTVAAVLLELAKIARVGLDRIVAQTALHSQTVEMAFNDPIPILILISLRRERPGRAIPV